VLETSRYQITAVNRLDDLIEQTKETFGWKAYVTDVPQEQLSLAQAVLCYRKEYRVERIFQRLKSRLNIAPLFVQRNDQVTGLTHFLTMGIRVLTLIEFVIRRSLKQDQVSLKGQVPSLVETPLVSALASGCDECFGIRPPGVRTGPLCFASRGFSLHAATRISADNRQGLEQLCRYVARPALAAGRLRIIDTDQLSFALKRPGQTAPLISCSHPLNCSRNWPPSYHRHGST
jgi:hypothetical protein